jgi:hypothetical protein
MAVRKRSIERGIYSVVSWCVHAAGLVVGFLHRRVPPRNTVASIVLHEPPRRARRAKDSASHGLMP